MLLETQWSSQLNPVIEAPLVNGNLIRNITVVSGSNDIIHKLARAYKGWIVTGMHGSFVQLYDTPNSMPSKVLTLNANASGSIDLFIF